MDEAIPGSWKSYQKLDNHNYRRLLYDSGDWSLVGIGVLVVVLEIIWTIIAVALAFGVLYLIRILRGSSRRPWISYTVSQNPSVESNELIATSVCIVSVRSSIAQSRESQDDGNLPFPGLHNERLCPGERCPSFGPRTDKKVTLSFSNLLPQPDDIELEYYNFDNVRWFANHLDLHEAAASAGDDFRCRFHVQVAV